MKESKLDRFPSHLFNVQLFILITSMLHFDTESLSEFLLPEITGICLLYEEKEGKFSAHLF